MPTRWRPPSMTAGAPGAELVAHSMGGAVAIVLAARRPDLVSRLVLTEANLDPAPAAHRGQQRHQPATTRTRS